MKNSSRCVVLLSATVLMWGSVSAQTVISIRQVENMLATGFTYIPDSVTTTVNIGKKGSNSLWDFSALKTSNSISLRDTPVANTPYAAQRPGATHALTGPMSLTYAGLSVAATAYRYFKYDKNPAGTSATLGLIGDMASGMVGGLFPAFGQWVNSQPDTMYALPVTYQKSWTSTYADTAVILLNGTPIVGPNLKTHKVTYTVDGYGMLKMPVGSTDHALRIRRVDSSSTGLEVKYIFVSDVLSRVELTVKDPTKPDSGVVEVTAPILWNATIPTGVQTAEALPVEYELRQNYPNPFNPTTVVSWQLPVASTVRLTVYDLLGREVATLVNEEKAAGMYSVPFDASGLASGTYVYRLQAGSFVESKKMILMR